MLWIERKTSEKKMLDMRKNTEERVGVSIRQGLGIAKGGIEAEG